MSESTDPSDVGFVTLVTACDKRCYKENRVFLLQFHGLSSRCDIVTKRSTQAERNKLKYIHEA